MMALGEKLQDHQSYSNSFCVSNIMANPSNSFTEHFTKTQMCEPHSGATEKAWS